jgi:hypothetical protein
MAAAALALRIAGKIAVGAFLPRSGAGRFGAGLGLLGHDGLALAAAAQIELLYGGAIGEAVLIAVALQAVAGDLLGPLGALVALKRRTPSAPEAPLAAHG